MSYAAQLIDAVKLTRDFKSYRELADALGVAKATLSEWRSGKGSPMPEERVMQLCEMAHIADPGPWLVGVQMDAVKTTAVRKALESVLDRVSPSVAKVATLGVVMLAVYTLPGFAENADLAAFSLIPSVHYAKFAVLVTAAAVVLACHLSRRNEDGTPAMLA